MIIMKKNNPDFSNLSQCGISHTADSAYRAMCFGWGAIPEELYLDPYKQYNDEILLDSHLSIKVLQLCRGSKE